MVTRILIGILLLASAPVYAAGLYGGGGLDLSNPSDGTGQFYADFGYGGGLYFEIPRPGSHIMPEIDAFFIRRLFSSGTGDAKYDYASNIIEVPFLLRVHIGDVFSIGGGGYVAYLIGSLAYSSTVASGTTTYPKTLDYGWVGSLRAEFSVKVPRPVFIEARYTAGVTNLSSTGGNLNYYDGQLLFGVRFGGK